MSEAKKEPVVAKAPAKKEAPKRKEPSIYIGPALQGGRLARYTVFKGGELAPEIAQIASEHRAIGRLIVPVSRLAEYERRLKDSTSAEAALYIEAGKVFSKGGNQ